MKFVAANKATSLSVHAVHEISHDCFQIERRCISQRLVECNTHFLCTDDNVVLSPATKVVLCMVCLRVSVSSKLLHHHWGISTLVLWLTASTGTHPVCVLWSNIGKCCTCVVCVCVWCPFSACCLFWHTACMVKCTLQCFDILNYMSAVETHNLDSSDTHIKPGSQYDTGATSIMTVTGKCFFFSLVKFYSWC